MTPEQKAEAKKKALAKARLVRDLAEKLYVSRYEMIIMEASKNNSDIKSREDFLAACINGAERSFEDANAFYDSWKRKRGAYITTEE